MGIDVDATLAHRIKIEMDKRGWSYGVLAKEMAKAGCAIQKGALHRVVNGNPNGGVRRLSAAEMVALAEVLGEPVGTDLLTPADEVEARRARELIAEFNSTGVAMRELSQRMLDMFVALFRIGATDPDVMAFIQGHIASGPTSAATGELSDIDHAMMIFTFSIIKAAGAELGIDAETLKKVGK